MTKILQSIPRTNSLSTIKAKNNNNNKSDKTHIKYSGATVRQLTEASLFFLSTIPRKLKQLIYTLHRKYWKLARGRLI